MQTDEKISRQSREIDRTMDEESATDKRESCEIPREAIGGGQSERTEERGNNCARRRLEEARGIPLYPP
jgi:hypothetical protein